MSQSKATRMSKTDAFWPLTCPSTHTVFKNTRGLSFAPTIPHAFVYQVFFVFLFSLFKRPTLNTPSNSHHFHRTAPHNRTQKSLLGSCIFSTISLLYPLNQKIPQEKKKIKNDHQEVQQILTSCSNQANHEEMLELGKEARL